MSDRKRLVDEIGIPSYCYDAVYNGAEKLIALSINDDDEEGDILFANGVSLLKTIGSFHHLKELKISFGHSEPVLIDVSPLSQLLQLECLIITNIPLQDISPLAFFRNLKLLHLSGADITDITPLRDLKQLTSLNLSHNHIVDTSPLKEHDSLTVVDLSANLIADISALQKLADIQSLFISSNQITDLKPLSGLTGLIDLQLSHNNITDIRPLQLLSGLLSLTLSQNPIDGLGPLAPLIHLELLEIDGIPANDLQPISEALKLKKLVASDIKFIDWHIISRFVCLTQLSLKNCNISDILFIKPLANLIYLQLDDNQIQNADILTLLPKLSWISLKNNRVSQPFLSYPYRSFTLNLEGNPFGKNFPSTEEYIRYVAFYYFIHNDLDKALAYHYLEVDKRNHIEESGKIALLIYYRKLSSVNHSDSYYRLYYIMRCEQLLKDIKTEDDGIKSVRIDVIKIIKESDFFNRAELLTSLEENGKSVDNYERFAEYLNYLKNTPNPIPNTEIAYFLAKTFMRQEDLPQLFSIYRQLLDKNHPYHFALYRMIRSLISNRHNFPDYDYYNDMLENAKDRQIPYFDIYKYLDWGFTGYVNGQPPQRPKSTDWQPQSPENYSGWKILCWVFAVLIIVFILYRFSI